MPEMDGFEFIEELKKNPEHRPIPIVVVTSKDLTQADRLRLNGGVAKLIEKKSFIHDDLLSEIRSTLATHPSWFLIFFFDTTFFQKLNLTYWQVFEPAHYINHSHWKINMDKYQEITEIVQEITEEAAKFQNATEPAEEVEGLKDLLDALTRGSKQVLERIDQYNDRRYR